MATDASQVGYRVQEILFGVDTTAVGRTNQVDGTLTIDGTQVTGVDFTVDVASITSDESRRDSAFRGRVMSADEFPTATFALTQPIDLGATPADGAEVTTQATGDLTLRGVTNPVTFDVTAKQESGLIGVQGSIPVVFNDYGIANPSNGGVQTEDDGLVEFILVVRAGEPSAHLDRNSRTRSLGRPMIALSSETSSGRCMIILLFTITSTIWSTVATSASVRPSFSNSASRRTRLVGGSSSLAMIARSSSAVGGFDR